MKCVLSIFASYVSSHCTYLEILMKCKDLKQKLFSNITLPLWINVTINEVMFTDKYLIFSNKTLSHSLISDMFKCKKYMLYLKYSVDFDSSIFFFCIFQPKYLSTLQTQIHHNSMNVSSLLENWVCMNRQYHTVVENIDQSHCLGL